MKNPGAIRPLQPVAQQPDLGAQRRARIEVSSPAAKTPPSIGNSDRTNRVRSTSSSSTLPGPAVSKSPRLQVRLPTCSRPPGSPPGRNSSATRTSPSDSSSDQPTPTAGAFPSSSPRPPCQLILAAGQHSRQVTGTLFCTFRSQARSAEREPRVTARNPPLP
jgi:hypothetical protein